MQQTGLIVEAPKPSDYKVGSSPLITGVRIENGNWKDYLPSTEKQFGIGFDSLSCSTFSALNSCEMQVNWLIRNKKLSTNQMQWLEDNGYIDANFNINFSDRFTAIMSGTTNVGNTLTNVWDSIRKDGLLPDSDFVFGGTTFAEYHDKEKITEAMKVKAKKLLEIFAFGYEWVFFDQDPAFAQSALTASQTALKDAPLHIGIPLPAGHAVTMTALDTEISIFDTYEPFVYQRDFTLPVHFALKGFVGIVPEVIVVPKTLKKGMYGTDVNKLQKDLKTLGFFKSTFTTLYFGPVTEAAVKAFQKTYGLVVDGIAGAKTLGKIEELKKKPKVEKDWGLLPLVQRKADEFLVKAKEAGYNIRITSGFRTKEEQEKLYNQGRTTPGAIVTNARYPQSLHCHGMAFDICFVGNDPYPSDDDLWYNLSVIGKSVGLEAGFDFSQVKDRPHYQFRGKYKYEDIYAFNYKKDGFL